MDQAQSLREQMLRLAGQQQQQQQLQPHVRVSSSTKSARVITITSGKGGVGKSNFSLNFALALKEVGKKAVILDLDLSTANINILMGFQNRHSLVDVLYRRKNIMEVIEKGIHGIEYISGGLNLQELADLDQQRLMFFWSQIQELQVYADYILLDTGAGISKELVDFIMASDETILVTTPEPTSVADAYSLLKTVMQFSSHEPPSFRLVVNRAKSYHEAVDTSRAIKNAAKNFLKLNVNTLGLIMEDPHVGQSVRQQTPFLILYPKCEAAKSIKQIVYSFLPESQSSTVVPVKGIRGFFEKILSIGRS